MGAIYGVISREDQDKAAEFGHEVYSKLQNDNFDYIQNMKDDEVYFGCGMIYNTPESLLEHLPRESENSRYIITADAIIDNRDELFETFGMDKTNMSSVADSELIIRAYEKWGYDCPKYLIGDYAFAIWDKERKELYCVRDPMGPRTLYFTFTSETFAFCTIERPLLGITGHGAELNEKWLASFLAIDGIQHELDYSETVYSSIYQLPPANYAIVNADGFNQVQYWDILKDVQPISFTSDEQYVEEFNKIFAEAVACRLRSVGETGIMLSGGMDSGSIACVAAKHLEKSNRKLYAFSSIPVKDFNEESNKKKIYNEKNEIELITQAYSNIDISYCSFEGNSSLTNIDKIIEIFEQPYKIYQNVTWYYPILQQAANSNCKIMLNGQVGNGTISYGDFRVHLLTLYRSGKFVSAVKEIHALSRILNVPLKRVYSLAAKVVMPDRVRKWRDQLQSNDFDRYKNVVVNQSLVDKWGLDKRLDQVGANTRSSKYLDYEEERGQRVNQMALTHIAAMETKLSLANRMTIRDPSRDRRVVEFCLSIPADQYVKDGMDRNLVRRAMKGILPEAIRTNVKTRGLQSADWMHRLKPVWDKAEEEIDTIIASEVIRPYMDINKLQQLRIDMKNCLDNQNEQVARLTLITIIFYRFLVNFNRLSSSEVLE